MFAWRYLGGGDAALGESDPFDDRASAEAWMAEAWASLRDRRVESVELVESADGQDTVRYRMSLADP